MKHGKQGAQALRAIGPRPLGTAAGLGGFALLGAGMAMSWPWLVVAGVLFSLLASVLLLRARRARVGSGS